MAIRITRKITGFSVVRKSGQSDPVQMHEQLERPEVLVGSTYKIKSPLVEHAMYVTINDVVLNPGTEHELRRPFEVFINSRNMDHFQWIVALTRIMSAVFRKGGDCAFLVEEMKAVFDPRGGYFKAGGVYMPSIVAEIGSVLEKHLTSIGMIAPAALEPAQQALVDEKRAAYAAMEASGQFAADSALDPGIADSGSFPASASLCLKCNTRAVVLLDGCHTCLNCGYSSCG